MIVDQDMSARHLGELAEAGFPGLLLSDLVELTDELMSQLPPPEASMELWEVVCQAFNNATVLAGRTSSTERLDQLSSVLQRFHDCLTGALPACNAETRKSVMEYIHHTENRQEVVLELIEQANSLSLFEIRPLSDGVDDETSAPSRPR
jgi:hypothetical protein